MIDRIAHMFYSIEYTYEADRQLHGILTPSVRVYDHLSGVGTVEYHDDGIPVNGPEGYHKITRTREGHVVELVHTRRQKDVLFMQVINPNYVHYYTVSLTSGEVTAGPIVYTW